MPGIPLRPVLAALLVALETVAALEFPAIGTPVTLCPGLGVVLLPGPDAPPGPEVPRWPVCPGVIAWVPGVLVVAAGEVAAVLAASLAIRALTVLDA
ncbi:hypothetical protein AB0L63_30895 [Nocardia sp. NPDC051990]|uniref:hypothetical protein n=1 Tax=Nocardia sp. NPDC051990 TaxID=3155285 RepID=UPI00341236EF